MTTPTEKLLELLDTSWADEEKRKRLAAEFIDDLYQEILNRPLPVDVETSILHPGSWVDIIKKHMREDED